MALFTGLTWMASKDMDRRTFGKIIAGLFAVPLAWLGCKRSGITKIMDVPGTGHNRKWQILTIECSPSREKCVAWIEYWDGKEWQKLKPDGFMFEGQTCVPLIY